MNHTTTIPQEKSTAKHDGPSMLRKTNTGTQTIDLNSLVSSEAHTTGSFDLRAIGATSLGKLLDAIPMPVVIIDQWHLVVFCNQGFSEMVPHTEMVLGTSFLNLVDIPQHTEKAAMLTDMTECVLNRAFETRQPEQVHTILKVESGRRWCRLHLRSVRVASQRHLLVVVQDLTREKVQERLFQREEQRLRHNVETLQKRLLELTESPAMFPEAVDADVVP